MKTTHQLVFNEEQVQQATALLENSGLSPVLLAVVARREVRHKYGMVTKEKVDNTPDGLSVELEVDE